MPLWLRVGTQFLGKNLAQHLGQREVRLSGSYSNQYLFWFVTPGLKQSPVEGEILEADCVGSVLEKIHPGNYCCRFLEPV